MYLRTKDGERAMDKNKFSLMEFLGGNGKKIKTDILTFAAVGAALIFMGGFMGTGTGKKEKTETKTESTASASGEISLEDRLKSILSKVDGAGRVDVLITVKSGKEIIAATEQIREDTATDETAANGDKRNITSGKEESKYVILENSDGSDRPLILKELEPEIEGVIIVAEGGGDIIVKNGLISAANAALGVPTHKIEVLKMKS